ncbi:uncharacterized protein LOC135197298 [Macrobrachium nipponense]|uniref:uncharacterized protein LOC135197298 n=1 Tax=Macrobrachium nipponense TaxID=159736 RepID=UPI0030C7B80C
MSLYGHYAGKGTPVEEKPAGKVADGVSQSENEGTMILRTHGPDNTLTDGPISEGTALPKCPLGVQEDNASGVQGTHSSPGELDARSQVIIPRCRRVKSLARNLQQRIYFYAPHCPPQEEEEPSEEAESISSSLSKSQEHESCCVTEQEGDSFQHTEDVLNVPQTADDNLDSVSNVTDGKMSVRKDEESLLAADLNEESPQHATFEVIADKIPLNPLGSPVLTEAKNIDSELVASEEKCTRNQVCLDAAMSVSIPENVSGSLRRVENKGDRDVHSEKDSSPRSEIFEKGGNAESVPCWKTTSSNKILANEDAPQYGASLEEDSGQKAVRMCDSRLTTDEVHIRTALSSEDYSIVRLRRSQGIHDGMEHDSYRSAISHSLPGRGERLSTMTPSKGRSNDLEGSLRSRKALSTLCFSNTSGVLRDCVSLHDTSPQQLKTLNKKKIFTKKTRKVPPPKPPRSRTRAKMLANSAGATISKTRVSLQDHRLQDNQETPQMGKDLQLSQDKIQQSHNHCEQNQNRSTVLLRDIDEEGFIAHDDKTPTAMGCPDSSSSSYSNIISKDSPKKKLPKLSSKSALDPKNLLLMRRCIKYRKSDASLLRKDEESPITPKKPPRPSIAFAKRCNLQEDQDLCSEHQALLDLYCSKCRLVICGKCQESSHNSKTHKVLSTPDALSMLRTETVALLRHYSLLRSMLTTLKRVYNRYANSNQNMKLVTEEVYVSLRLGDETYLTKVVEEAEELAENAKNLSRIKGKVKEWETHQHDWGHVVFLVMRCKLLGNINAANDKVFIRLKEWVLPTPWIHLSHLLQPYLGDDINSTTLTPVRRGSILRKQNRSSELHGKSSEIALESRGQDVKTFPYNSTSVLVHSLLPYIIFNPVVRYFMHINNNINADITLVVEPSEEHVHQYLSRQRYTATYSPGTLRRNGYEPSDDALTIVEKQMMMGGKQRSRLIASYKSSAATGSSPAENVLVKVCFPDIKVVSGGLGLAVAVGSLKKGDIIVDSDPARGPNLSVVITNVGEVPALRFGHVVQGLESFKCLVENEEKRRNEGMGIRAKIRATVKREEEATYDITFGLNI